MKDRNRLVLAVLLLVLAAVGLALAGAWQSRDPNADIAGLELSELFAERYRLRLLGARENGGGASVQDRARRRFLIEERLQAGDPDDQIEQAAALLASGEAATRRGAMRWLAGTELGAGRGGDLWRPDLVPAASRFGAAPACAGRGGEGIAQHRPIRRDGAAPDACRRRSRAEPTR